MAVKKELDVVLKDPCPKCGGTGAKPGTSPETCPKCGGKGQVVYTQQSFFGTVQNVQTCPDCHGTGKIIREKCPGLWRHRLCIQPQEDICDDSGRYRQRSERADPRKRRAWRKWRTKRRSSGGGSGCPGIRSSRGQDMHIFSTVPISFAQAALGADIRIRTVDGEVLYTVKPGTKTDTKVRPERQGRSIREKLTGKRRSLCNIGDPDTRAFKPRGKRSLA